MTTARSSRPDEPTPTPPLARLVELALVVPVEVSTRLVEAVPAVADKVPAAAERIRREIVLARFLGKLVVDQGVRELRARLAPAEPAPEIVADPTEVPSIGANSSDELEPAPEMPDVLEVPGAETLALADFDHLSSAQIVAKLDGLDTVERSAIERYELAGRHRRTILGKLDQLRTIEGRS